MNNEKNIANLSKGYIVMYRDLTQPSITSELYYDLSCALDDARRLSDCYENLVISIYKNSTQNLQHISSFYHGKVLDLNADL